MMRRSFFLSALLLLSVPAQAQEAIQLCAEAESSNPPAEFANVREMRAGNDGWLYAQRDFKLVSDITPYALGQLKRLTDALKANGTTLVIALIPRRSLLTEQHLSASLASPGTLEALRQAYQTRRAALADYGAIVPDLLYGLSAQHQDMQLFFSRDHHWTPDGAALAARLLAQQIASLPGMERLPSTSFTTTTSQIAKNTGSYAQFANKACHLELPPEPYEQRETLRSNASLLDDDTPGIVLAGTSYSNPRFNFSGALSEALGHDVLNVAVDGGGIDEALVNYLSTSSFAEKRPAFIIWETPDLYSFNGQGYMWRQMVPAAEGACNDVSALAVASQPFTPSTTLFDNLDLKINPSHDFIYLETDSKSAAKLTLHISYMDGTAEDVALTRTTKVENSGRFFLQLNSTRSNLRGVSLSTTSPASGLITARLCPGTP